MSQTTDPHVRWTTTDLNLLPDSSNRYEIINGDLLVTKAPHWGHQKASGNAHSELRDWSITTGLGETVQAPGVVFSDADNVIPDVVWISKERLATSLDEAGHLTVAPELIVEVLSPGADNERRECLRHGKAERETKLKLYTSRGVQDYWIIDWRLKQVEVYRRQAGMLQLVGTLFPGDTLTSPLLLGFACDVERLFF